MNEEELKAGERYNFTLLYTGQSINNKFRFESPTGIHYILGLGDMEAVSPVSAHENGIKNTEPAPKYDPCRLLKEGDRVQVKRRNGRCNGKYGEYLREAFCIVAEDETPNELVRVYHNSSEYRLDPAYLELVTPVEEMERYVLIHNEFAKNYEVCWKDDDEPDGQTGRTRCRAKYWYHQPPQSYSKKEAKEAAETECDRLNAEYRKGANNE